MRKKRHGMNLAFEVDDGKQQANVDHFFVEMGNCPQHAVCNECRVSVCYAA